MLEFFRDGLTVRHGLFASMESPARDGDDLIEIFAERCWRRLRLRSEKQFGLGENALSCARGSCVAPGVVDCGGLPRGPVLLGEDPRHALALFAIDTGRRGQIAHGDLRRDAAFTDLLLHGLRQDFHQRQAARHPGGAAVEAPGQFLDGAVQAGFHFRQQPALFERRLRLAVHAQRPHQHQSIAFAHVPDERLDGIAAELFEGGYPLMTVDDQIALRLGDDDDGCLLTGFNQRGQEAPVSRRVADPEVSEAEVELMKLQLRHCRLLGFQYAGAGIWSFPAEWGCCGELALDQQDRQTTGLSWR